MVTAILIPIICFYFYWLSKKEVREYEQKWLDLTQLREEAIVKGKILSLTEARKRYYYHKYIHVVQIKLQTETKIVSVTRVTPYMKKQNEALPFMIGDTVKLYGNWEESEFRFLRYEIEN